MIIIALYGEKKKKSKLRWQIFIKENEKKMETWILLHALLE